MNSLFWRGVCHTEEAPLENLKVGSEAEEVVSVGIEWWDLQLGVSVILVGSGARNRGPEWELTEEVAGTVNYGLAGLHATGVL